jgi:transcription-repair coupling factor (superfamily II helicase)
MYLDMLEHAVKALRAGRVPEFDQPLAATSEVELHVPALLPADYVPDVHLRLSLYQRMAAADATQLRDLGAELVDRFGPLSDAASNLLQLAGLRVRARALGIRRLELRPLGGSVQFETENRVDTGSLLQLIQKQPRDYRLDGPLKLRMSLDLDTPAERFAHAATLLDLLGGTRAA